MAHSDVPPGTARDSLLHTCLTNPEFPSQVSLILASRGAIPALSYYFRRQLSGMMSLALLSMSFSVNWYGARQPRPGFPLDGITQCRTGNRKLLQQGRLGLTSRKPSADLHDDLGGELSCRAIFTPVSYLERLPVECQILVIRCQPLLFSPVSCSVAHPVYCIFNWTAPPEIYEPVIERTTGTMTSERTFRGTGIAECFENKLVHKMRFMPGISSGQRDSQSSRASQPWLQNPAAKQPQALSVPRVAIETTYPTKVRNFIELIKTTHREPSLLCFAHRTHPVRQTFEIQG